MIRFIPALAVVTATLLSGCSGGTGYPGDPGKVAAEDRRWTVIRHDTSTDYAVPDRLLFATDSSQVLPAGHKIIAELAEVAKRQGGPVEVDGFTDTVGSARHNDKLSIARAEAVAIALSQNGIARQRIETRGYGERNLAVDTPDNMPEAKNRRVVVKIADS